MTKSPPLEAATSSGLFGRQIPSPIRAVSRSPTRDPSKGFGAVAPPAPALISSSLGAGGEDKGEISEGDQPGRTRGRPRGAFTAKVLNVPAPPGKGRQWLAGANQLTVTAQQLLPGMFLQTWIEAQPNLPHLKQPTVALFYVLGVGTLRSGGLDVQVRAVAARTRELMTQLEKGPLSIDAPGGKPACVHLCPDGRCVLKEESELGYIRIHALAYLVFTRSQLTESWHREGLQCLDEIVEKDDSYPKMVSGPGESAFQSSTHGKGRELGAQVGGSHTPGAWSHNVLGLDPATLRAASSSASSSYQRLAESSRDSSERAKKAFEDATAEARSEAFALKETKLQAEASLRELDRQKRELADLLKQTRDAAVLSAAEAEAKRADQKPSRSRAPEVQPKKKEKRKRREPSSHSHSSSKGRTSPSPDRRGRDKKSKARRLSKDRYVRSQEKSRRPEPSRGRSKKSKDHRRSKKRSPNYDRKSRPKEQREAERSRGDRHGKRGGSQKRPRTESPRFSRGTGLPPRPAIRIPGLTHALGVYDLEDRKPGIFGSFTPKFKSSEIQRWLSAQIAWADAQRAQVMAHQRAEKKRKKKKARKDAGRKDRRRRRRGSSTDSSPSSSTAGESSSASAQEEKRRKRLKCLLLAKEHPGVVFASMTASTREVLGQIGCETDLGPQGPLYRKWWDTHFTKAHARAKLEPHWDEFQLLVTLMDEFHAGRMLEVGDIIASRLRMLTAGIEKGTWSLARRFLVYHQQDLSMVSDELMDEALKVEAAEKKREKALLAARSDAPRR